jgi:hypothetical protein
MMPMPRPVSALHSISILPDIMLPATKTGSESANDTLTLEWNGDAFMGSGLVCIAVVAGIRFPAILYTMSGINNRNKSVDDNRRRRHRGMPRFQLKETDSSPHKAVRESR